MKKEKTSLWLIATVGILAGFLLGLWVGSQFLTRAQGTQLSELTGEAQDQYVTLVALGYDATGDFEQATAQLAQLEMPNQALLVEGVLERAAKNNAPTAYLAALARLALALGVPEAALKPYLPTPTPLPTPTNTPPPTPTPAPVTGHQATDTPAAVAQAPTATATATPPPTATPTPKPMVVTDQAVNIRSGPGTNYPVIGSLAGGEQAEIVGQNPSGSWWQIRLPNEALGWVFAEIVTTLGDTLGIPVAANIPTPPPTPTPAPPPTPTTPPKPAVDFVVKSVRLWGPQENGGWFDGPSLHCGEKRQLRAIVLDASGQPLNGVTILGIYSGVEQVTGSKGPGIAEWILGDGDGLRVVRDVDGREVQSETADGMVTDPHRIPDDILIAAGYCHDAASCQALRDANACRGHYSWDVTFQRTY
ncbi:MAG TPA: SH3 domain-containing protein [Anaerolineae bacterium]|nr:SH3 domain-containing protein [Anaerolineae bacterium]